MDARILPLPADGDDMAMPPATRPAQAQAAPHADSDGCAASADDVPTAMVLDVRRLAVFQQADTMLPGARWRDPATVEHWSRELPTDVPVIVYCVHGHEVSRSTAMRLRNAGVDARYLADGIEGWRAAGRGLIAKASDGA